MYMPFAAHPAAAPCPCVCPPRFGFAYGVGNNPNGFIGDNMLALARDKTRGFSATGGYNWQL